MSDFPSPVQALSANLHSQSSLETGRPSYNGLQPPLGVNGTLSQSSGDLMGSSANAIPTSGDADASNVAPVSVADLGLSFFGSNNVISNGPAIWRDWDPTLEAQFSQLYGNSNSNQPIGEGAQSMQQATPREFDIPQARSIAHPSNQYTVQRVNQITSGDQTVQPGKLDPQASIQLSSVNPLASAQVASQIPAERPEGLQSGARTSSITVPRTGEPDAKDQVPANKTQGQQGINSMDVTETVNSPQSSPAQGNSSKAKNYEHNSPVRERALLPTVNPSPILPAGKVFPIQIGSELFKLSGASISSDAPSYFSQFFSEQLLVSDGRNGSIRTLYIDRDPATFKDILLHLQGYHLKARDAAHFVRLFADAQFYSLPRLIRQLLYSEIHINIGDTQFQIPREAFSAPGDSPNYFTLGFGAFFSSPNEAFPGLDRQGLLRPPSIHPPSLPNRSAEVFKELLHYLKGYPIEVRNETHRATLLKEARYFHFKGLEQRLLPHQISFNAIRQRREILLRLEDIRQSGLSFTSHQSLTSNNDNASSTPSSSASPPTSTASSAPASGGILHYSRPYVDEESYELIIEVSDETTVFDLDGSRVSFAGQTKARIASLLQVLVNKMNLPATQPLGLMFMATGAGLAAQPASPSLSGLSEDSIKVRVEEDALVQLDGRVLDRKTTAVTFSSRYGDGGMSDDGMAGDADGIGDEQGDDTRQSPRSISQQRPLKRRRVEAFASASASTGPARNSSDNSAAAQNRNTEYARDSDVNDDDTGMRHSRHENAVAVAVGHDTDLPHSWTLLRSQWRIRVEPTASAAAAASASATTATTATTATAKTPSAKDTRTGMEVIFCAVRLDGLSGERERNARRGFLT